MKFLDKYPEAKPGIPPEPRVVWCLHEQQERSCVVCGEVTGWFHREFIVHVCSEECVERLVEQN